MASIAFEVDVTSYAQTRIDNTGVGSVVYYGFTKHAKAVDADPKWLVIKETVTGTVTSLVVASFDTDESETQVWANRATLTYAG